LKRSEKLTYILKRVEEEKVVTASTLPFHIDPKLLELYGLKYLKLNRISTTSYRVFNKIGIFIYKNEEDIVEYLKKIMNPVPSRVLAKFCKDEGISDSICEKLKENTTRSSLEKVNYPAH